MHSCILTSLFFDRKFLKSSIVFIADTIHKKFTRIAGKMVKKREKMEDSNRSLPHDIIFDILSRIPVENLIPLSSLSKEWSNLIYNPSFVNAHTHHVRPKPVLIFQSTDRSNTIISLDMETGKRKAFHFKPETDYNDYI